MRSVLNLFFVSAPLNFTAKEVCVCHPQLAFSECGAQFHHRGSDVCHPLFACGLGCFHREGYACHPQTRLRLGLFSPSM